MTWLTHASRMRVIATGEAGTRLPLLGDAHMHLGLTDPTALLAGGIARVQELGWVPAIAARWRTDALESAAAADATALLTGMNAYPEIQIAGAFLAAPGGYPSDRSWAPAPAVREVQSGADVAAAVAEQVAVGASVIKITLHSEAGPVFDDATLAALVATAHTIPLRVVAHVEGPGQFARAVTACIDVLAHTPFSEAIPDALLKRAIAQGQQWMSTLDIHGYGAPDARQALSRDFALDNLKRFVQLGGVVIYGTDLGNGKLPVGVNAREVRGLLEVGLTPDEVILAMTRWWAAPAELPGADRPATSGPLRATFVPDTGGPPQQGGFPPPGNSPDADHSIDFDHSSDVSHPVDFADWLSHARVVNASDLEPVEPDASELETL